MFKILPGIRGYTIQNIYATPRSPSLTLRNGHLGSGSCRAQARGCSRSHFDYGWPPGFGKVQGHHQGIDAVWRSPSGDGSESRGGRLDRGAVEELWLFEYGADQV